MSKDDVIIGGEEYGLFSVKRVAELEAWKTEHIAAYLRLEAQLAEYKNKPATGLQWIETVDKHNALKKQLEESQEVIVCLETEMPMSDRLLNQRSTINKLTEQLAAVRKLCECRHFGDKLVNASKILAVIGDKS